MICSLCEKEILNYNIEFNHLKIDELHTFDICQECIDKIVKWQQKIFARLFPTSALKKRYGEQK
ncbi:MAG: hypothetical protein ACFFD1_06590 [Candidatus Thorarchaeota archaeon]